MFKVKIRQPYKNIIFTTLGIALVIFLWWILALIINKTLFPGPIKTFNTLGTLIIKESTWAAIGGTLFRLVTAFVLSFVAALIFGILGGISEVFRTIFNPIIVVLRTIPTAAVIFVLIILIKPTYGLLVIDFLLMFPILYEAVVSGVKNVDKTLIDAVKLDAGANTRNGLFKVVIPMAWPYIILGIVQSLGLGMKVSIMSEVLCGDDRIPGLGRMINQAYQETNVPVIFAITVISILLIAILDLSLNFLKRKYKNN
jgi:NitT/TauT family transport system permease protein